ncbi:MAG: hypothetical protein JSU06_02810 [Actinobacteria bacterium]|nr:hypothetical protein [Actinomycetota bacterium]
MSGFLVGLVVLGLLGVPALLVAAIGTVVAAVGIGLFHRRLEGRARGSSRAGGGRRVPDEYVPRVLESSSRRRRAVRPGRRRHASAPLRFR